VYHYFHLQEITSETGPIFNFTLDQLRCVDVFCKNNPSAETGKISTLEEILEIFGGKVGIEIHIQGPEPEAADMIGAVLRKFRNLWSQIEATSYDSAMLLSIQEICPGLAVDFLLPRSESWMTTEIVQYRATHLTRLAQARAVHLHPTQLSKEIVAELHNQGIVIHAWDVNDEGSLELITKLGISRICTDEFVKAFEYREKL
jgi:glycerophosphoryl diester phosphodiesterase